MNTKLLRIIRNPTVQTSRWTVTGFGNGIRYHARHSYWKVPCVSWPVMIDGYEVVRSARLDWHHGVVYRELRTLLKQVAK